MSYTYDTFLKPLSGTDTKIQIVDTNGTVTHIIDPFTVVNSMYSGKFLKITLRNQTILDIPFLNENEVKLALQEFNIQKSTLTCGRKDEDEYVQIFYQFSHGSIDPLDSVSYYIGNITDLPPQTTSSDSRKVKSNYKGEVRSVTITTNISGVLGSQEAQVFSIKNITKGKTSVIVSNYFNDSANKIDTYELTTPLSVDVDDEMEIIWETPVFSTPPISVRHYFNVYMVV